MTTHWPRPAGLHTSAARLPVEGTLPSFDGATGWLNSPPLTPASLRGKGRPGQLLHLHLRQLATPAPLSPRLGREILCLRAGRDRRAYTRVRVRARSGQRPPGRVQDMRIGYPVAIDSDYAVWNAFDNHYWPALYFADTQGHIRHHHFGEGEYQQSEMVIQYLLAEAGSAGAGHELVSPEADGVEAPADWATLRSPENYTGYERTENFASPGGAVPGKRHLYQAPAQLRLNHWALCGDWTIEEQAATLNAADGQIAYRCHARDLNLVMGPAVPGIVDAIPAYSSTDSRRVRRTGPTSTNKAAER